MPQDEKPLPSEPSSPIQSAMMAMAIPGLMVAGPVVGYLLGRWIGGFFLESPTPAALVGLALGFAAGVREVIRLIRRISKE